ncbi:hypothetical protein ADIARSV_2356 [Arcticibacter svalbardensis MN12-7]|uniref:Pvc16 N-terminal domain-containing protein n=1 Tax=Arcticibacter svalbardensis MN12-7 TaxID=1150600 RepID=R9GSH4_9SPHI|nr:DUF4255 domain-containing protein [Arcticibacter svalbardensis]EOR94510.1 hypothetical protein ADIARSV_2356 [Arcticibacter svalbardensis MN12-7]
MLRTAIEFLCDELNAYLKRKDTTNFGNEDVAMISSLMNPDGTFAVVSDGGDISKIILTMVNLEEDRILDSQVSYRKVDDKYQVINPPINLNVFVVFSVYTNNYATALRLLSYVISFFQGNQVFDSGQYPHINAKVADDKPWQKVGRLLVNLHSTTFEQQNNLWAALGAKYMPSVIYKIRTMSFIDLEPKMEAPPITEVTISDK